MPLSGLPGGIPYSPAQTMPSGSMQFQVNPIDDVSLSQDERGIVLPQEIYEGGNASGGRNAVDGELLRYCLAFWDKVAVAPAGGFFGGFPYVEEAETLVEQGILRRVDAQTSVMVSGAMLGPTVASVIHALETAQPDQWALARPVGPWHVNEGPPTDNSSISFNLVNALAVPHVDAPIHEVLEFKEGRRAELLALRAELDNVRKRVSLSENPGELLSIELSNLDRALLDHLRVSREAKIPLMLANQKMKISWRTWSVASQFAMGAGLLSGVTALPLMGAALAGLVGAVAGSYEAEVIRRPKPALGSAYEYAALFKRQFTLK